MVSDTFITEGDWSLGSEIQTGMMMLLMMMVMIKTEKALMPYYYAPVTVPNAFHMHHLI